MEQQAQVTPPPQQQLAEASVTASQAAAGSSAAAQRPSDDGMVPGLAEVRAKMDRETNDLFTLADAGADQGWRTAMVKDGVEICRKIQSPMHFFRGRTIVKAPPAAVARQVYGVATMHETDPMLIEAREVTRWDRELFCGYIAFNSGFRPFISDRDFCMAQLDRALPNDTYVSFSSSIERPDVPAVKGRVRGLIYSSGYLIRPRFPNDLSVTELTYVTCMDPKGWLPPWVSNYVSVEQPLIVAAVRKVVEAAYAADPVAACAPGAPVIPVDSATASMPQEPADSRKDNTSAEKQGADQQVADAAAQQQQGEQEHEAAGKADTAPAEAEEEEPPAIRTDISFQEALGIEQPDLTVSTE